MDERRPRRTQVTKAMSPAASRWWALIAGCSRSGQTQRSYCRRMKISAGTFAWWKHRLADSLSAPAPVNRRAQTSPRFVRVVAPATGATGLDPLRDAVSSEVSLRSTSTGSAPLEILLPGDIRVRIGVECDSSLLVRVLAVLREAGR